MVKKIHRVSSDKMRDLDGFKEVFDLFEEVEFKEGSLDPRSGDDNFELYHFLDNENHRLQLLDRFYSSKAKTLIDHPQSKVLIEEQKQKRDTHLTKLTRLIAAHDSAFNEEMERLFNKAYRPAEKTTESDD